MVKDIPRNDANVFPEYILSTIAPLATYNSIIVRVACARNIASLAETAVYFLEQTQLNCPNELPGSRYEAELGALHEMLQQIVSTLLTDQQPIVKQTLMESGIIKLCVFFGKQKSNDVILSHMITFLNDKEDKSLRGSFFDCVVGVVAYVGWQSSDILIPLVQQGLTDSEEFVIAKSIRATTSLIELGLIQKTTLTEFIAESACYLNHPNIWIRHEICGLISTTARTLTAIDVQCKIMPAIIIHLKTPLIQVEKPEILLDCLNPPIPRNIFDGVMKFSEIHNLIRVLEERKETRVRVAEGVLPQYGEMGAGLKNLFRRLISEGLTDFVEMQLLSMKSFFFKINKYKNQEPKSNSNGKVVLKKETVLYHKYSLINKNIKNDDNSRKIRHQYADVNPNSEWQHVFGTINAHLLIPSSPSNDSGSPVAAKRLPPGTRVQPTVSSSLVEYSMPDRRILQERVSECCRELEKLRHKIKSRYAILASNRDFNATLYHSAIPSTWRMTGTLVAHLHEHKSSVVKLASLKPYGPLFASGSIDGTIRLWDCTKLNGNQSINRSRQVYSANTPIYSVTYCDAGQSIAVGGKDGTLLILRIDRNSAKMTLQQAIYLDGSNVLEGGYDDGPIVDMHSLDQTLQSVVIYATLYGGIVATDLRMHGNVWRLQNDLRHGVITTFCVDPTSSWLAAGTSGGKHICWDLRFRLPIAEIRHPFDSWIRKVSPHPTEPSWLISASQGNNEVSVWNIETGHRQTALWASAAPPLSNASNSNPSTTCGLLPGITNGKPFLLTGSSDQRIRHWDFACSKDCCIVVPSSKDNKTNTCFNYNDRLIDGTRVIYEITRSLGTGGDIGSGNAGEQPPRSGPELSSPSHKGCITDFLMCEIDRQQTLVVSSGRDGVIKLWK